jgi:hypothetical protein
LLAALLTVSAMAGRADSLLPPGAPTEKSVEALALDWFAQMRSGQIDRTQLAAEYSAQLTDDVVQETAQYLREYAYGASPTSAEVVNTRTSGKQTFYVVKLVFPRGDAASLLIGFQLRGQDYRP